MPALLVLLTSLASACGSIPYEPGPRPEGTGTVVVTVSGMEDDRGQLLINLFLEPKGFPGDPDAAWADEALEIEDGRASVVFEDVPAGMIALSTFHDIDENFKLDVGFFGPTEPWAASRDARRMFEAPTFTDAMIELRPNEMLAVEMRVR